MKPSTPLIALTVTFAAAIIPACGSSHTYSEQPTAGSGGSGCNPKTCAQLGAECGSASDTCGGTVDCAECSANLVCGSGGPNKCGVGSGGGGTGGGTGGGGGGVGGAADSGACLICSPNWHCGPWSNCACGNQHTRTCNDLNNCGSAAGKPSQIESCDPCTTVAANGVACGGAVSASFPYGCAGTLYTCSATHTTASAVQCPNGCHKEPEGTPDFCNPDASCTSGDTQSCLITVSDACAPGEDQYCPGQQICSSAAWGPCVKNGVCTPCNPDRCMPGDSQGCNITFPNACDAGADNVCPGLQTCGSDRAWGSCQGTGCPCTC